MLNFLLFAGAAWLLLTLFEPLVAYFDAKAACDRKYAPARARRAEIYEELAAIHRQSPVYQKMKEEKREKKKSKPSPNNAKARRARRRKPLQEAYQEKLAAKQKTDEESSLE